MNSDAILRDQYPSPLDIQPYETPAGCVQQPMPPEQARHVLSDGEPSSEDCLDWTNYAAALYVAGQDQDALNAAIKAVSFGRNSTTLLNLGVILEAHGEFVQALMTFAEAQALDPANILAGAAYADGLVRLGRWWEGWRLYAIYHSRMALEYMRIPTLADCKGHRILIVANGGAGDNFYHVRWLKHFREAGCHITFAGPSSLVSLLRPHPWIDAFLESPTRTPVIEWHTMGAKSSATESSYSINLNDFDVYLSSMSVPAVIRPRHDKSIWPGPYIPIPTKRRLWPAKYAGICWKAGEKRFPRAHRTLNSVQLYSLLTANKGIKWVNLTADEKPPVGVRQFPLRTWRDTAEIINALDLVVTVDTGVAHLAAAMGKRVYVMLPTASAWPYGLGDDYRMAYPSMWAFRNRGFGIDDAVNRVAEALQAERAFR